MARNLESNLIEVIPVIPSSDIQRDIQWYEEQVGFEYAFGDDQYAGIRLGKISIHLQWHADTEDDPLLGGSVVKFFVKEVIPIFKEMLRRGTVQEDAIRLLTPWNTNEFGFYDLNKNAIFFVEDIQQK